MILHILGKALGKGTFGKVKLAIHTLTKEKVSFLSSDIFQKSILLLNHSFDFCEILQFS